LNMNTKFAYIISLFLSFVTAHPLLGATIAYNLQYYDDTSNVTNQSHVLQFRNEFFFLKDPANSTNINLRYQLDNGNGLLDQTQDLSDDQTTHGISVNVAQGIFASTTILANIGSSFSPGTHTITLGAAINQRLFRNSTSIIAGYNNVSGKKLSQNLINNELLPITTSDERIGSDFYSSITQTFTKSTVGRVAWRYVKRNEQTDGNVISLRLHQWLPTRSALQLEYSYFFNVGDVPQTSTLGKLDAHIVDFWLKQYLSDSTIVALNYRFYKEREQVESNFYNIVGSDLYGIKLTQNIAPLLSTIGLIENSLQTPVNLEIGIQRYLNNQDNSAWGASMGATVAL